MTDQLRHEDPATDAWLRERMEESEREMSRYAKVLRWIRKRSHGRLWNLTIAAERWPDNLAKRVAWLLPKRVVLWAYVRVGAHATTGEYENTEVQRSR